MYLPPDQARAALAALPSIALYSASPQPWPPPADSGKPAENAGGEGGAGRIGKPGRAAARAWGSPYVYTRKGKTEAKGEAADTLRCVAPQSSKVDGTPDPSLSQGPPEALAAAASLSPAARQPGRERAAVADQSGGSQKLTAVKPDSSRGSADLGLGGRVGEGEGDSEGASASGMVRAAPAAAGAAAAAAVVRPAAALAAAAATKRAAAAAPVGGAAAAVSPAPEFRFGRRVSAEVTVSADGLSLRRTGPQTPATAAEWRGGLVRFPRLIHLNQTSPPLPPVPIAAPMFSSRSPWHPACVLLATLLFTLLFSSPYLPPPTDPAATLVWQVDPPVATAGRAYLEFEITAVAAGINGSAALLGVTAEAEYPKPGVAGLHLSPLSHVYFCRNSLAVCGDQVSDSVPFRGDILCPCALCCITFCRMLMGT
jgi:hypothetical protein